MGRTFIKAILNSARGLHPDDNSPAAQNARRIGGFADLDGIEFVGKVDWEKDSTARTRASSRPRSRPDHKDYAALMAGAARPAGATRRPRPTPTPRPPAGARSPGARAGPSEGDDSHEYPTRPHRQPLPASCASATWNARPWSCSTASRGYMHRQPRPRCSGTSATRATRVASFGALFLAEFSSLTPWSGFEKIGLREGFAALGSARGTFFPRWASSPTSPPGIVESRPSTGACTRPKPRHLVTNCLKILSGPGHHRRSSPDRRGHGLPVPPRP